MPKKKNILPMQVKPTKVYTLHNAAKIMEQSVQNKNAEKKDSILNEYQDKVEEAAAEVADNVKKVIKKLGLLSYIGPDPIIPPKTILRRFAKKYFRMYNFTIDPIVIGEFILAMNKGVVIEKVKPLLSIFMDYTRWSNKGTFEEFLSTLDGTWNIAIKLMNPAETVKKAKEEALGSTPALDQGLKESPAEKPKIVEVENK